MKIQINNPLPQYGEAIARLSDENVVTRMWKHDPTIWAQTPDEITNRLGWLHLPENMGSQIPHISSFVDSVRNAGYTHAVVLGMGGSSLAPDVLARIFGRQPDYLELHVLDSTHPETVRAVREKLPLKHTLFIVATKSGTTSETLALFRFFYQELAHLEQDLAVGDHFVAITDPGTSLVPLAADGRFRDVFLNDPNVGGRYSALSLFGLIPAALLGLDIRAMLRIAQQMAAECLPDVTPSANPAVQLGALLASCARSGRDKATLWMSPQISPFADWIEQLIAESTGKQGKGIVPVIETEPDAVPPHCDDRVGVILSLRGDSLADTVACTGLPVAKLEVASPLELAGQFFVWEFATAIACHILGVQPFDQPNVESAKRLARAAANEARDTGRYPRLTGQTMSLDVLAPFLAKAECGDYISIHAYLPSAPKTTEALQSLRAAIRTRTQAAITIGYGPRFLHSTGQLHKGDRGNGHFIQLISSDMPDVAIPDAIGGNASSLSFGALIAAQAIGDRQALEAEGRSVITFSLPPPANEAIWNMALLLRAAI